MRALIQRVKAASVQINHKAHSSIGNGVLVFLGICHEDTEEDINWLVQKILNMRIFSDDEEKMNLSLLDVKGELLIVSQFTLHASTKKGNRPSFIQSAPPEFALPLYRQFITLCYAHLGHKVKTGEFGAMMQVSLVNDGPVTIMLDSKNKT